VQANHTNALAYDRVGTLLVRTGQQAEGIQNLQKAVCYDKSQALYRQHLSSAASAGGAGVPPLLQYQFNVFHNPADYSYRLQLATALRQMEKPYASGMKTLQSIRSLGNTIVQLRGSLCSG